MKRIKLYSTHPRDEVLSMIKDNTRVNDGVRFGDKKGGKPFMHVKENGDKLRIKCEMMGRPSKDNGFLVGTVFRGRITEKDGYTQLSGFITTSLIYHLVMIALFLFLLIRMIITSSYTMIPMLVFVVAFELLFFKDEFKKQGYIERYLIRALRRLDTK